MGPLCDINYSKSKDLLWHIYELRNKLRIELFDYLLNAYWFRPKPIFIHF